MSLSGLKNTANFSAGLISRSTAKKLIPTMMKSNLGKEMGYQAVKAIFEELKHKGITCTLELLNIMTPIK